MQTQRELNLKLKPGGPASAVPRSWFLFVNNVLKFLVVRNGRLIAQQDKWTIVCEPPPTLSWSGRVFFGGELVDVPDVEIDSNTGLPNFEDWKHTHVKINLRTGLVTGENWDEEDTDDLDEHEYYHVFKRVQIPDPDNPGDTIFVYRPSGRTVGDIHCRVT
jgi:hypothetical protein